MHDHIANRRLTHSNQQQQSRIIQIGSILINFWSGWWLFIISKQNLLMFQSSFDDIANGSKINQQTLHGTNASDLTRHSTRSDSISIFRSVCASIFFIRLFSSNSLSLSLFSQSKNLLFFHCNWRLIIFVYLYDYYFLLALFMVND